MALAFGKLTGSEWNSFIILHCAFVCVLKESYGAIYFALEAGENASCCTKSLTYEVRNGQSFRRPAW